MIGMDYIWEECHVQVNERLNPVANHFSFSIYIDAWMDGLAWIVRMLHTHMHACAYVHTCMHVHTYIHTYVHTHIHACAYIRIYGWMDGWMDSTGIHTHVHIIER